MKFAGKIETFVPTGEGAETQLRLRRYAANIALRSPAMAVISEYGRATFTPAALNGVEKEPLRSHLATALLMGTQGDTLYLCMNSWHLRSRRSR